MATSRKWNLWIEFNRNGKPARGQRCHSFWILKTARH